MHRAIFRRGSLVELFAGKCPRKQASNQESPGEVVPGLHPPPGKSRSGKTRWGEKVRVELGVTAILNTVPSCLSYLYWVISICILKISWIVILSPYFKETSLCWCCRCSLTNIPQCRSFVIEVDKRQKNHSKLLHVSQSRGQGLEHGIKLLADEIRSFFR